MQFSYVYILASKSRVLYIGVTSDLRKRVEQHKEGQGGIFSQKYKTNRLVYFEVHEDIKRAIEREKELKGWRREKKIALIEENNIAWENLSMKLY